MNLRFTRLAFLLVPFAALLLLAAAPVQTGSPEDLVRRANEAFRAGHVEEADALYTAAEERTTDPGLVAFNRAAILFERGEFRDAERHYERVLADAACPPDRAAKAWYNRGTCLLRRGGTASVYRSAVACFENAIESNAADEPLKADARHNLEIAKLLWLEEVKKQKKDEPPSPNSDIPPEEDHQPRPQPERTPGGQDVEPGPDTPGGVAPKLGPQQVAEKKDGPTPKTDGQNVAGNNANLDVLQDTSEVQSLSPDDARAILKGVAERRKRELRSLLETLSGPNRPDVRDW